jgi:esterase/lipase
VTHPAPTYEQALTRIQNYQAQEGGDINSVCRSQLLTHGHKTERAIVFFHGFTSCPRQFVPLGEKFFDLGYNVFLPREPHHGYQDLLTTTLKDLTAEVMIDRAGRAIDITRGLGERVTVCGLSMGGTVAAWAAQFRPDVYRAVIIAPPFEVGAIPRFIHKPFTRVVLAIPNFFVWWDPKLKEKNDRRPPFSYPRYASHALAENWKLAIDIRRAAQHEAPAAQHILVITNANDHTIRNEAVHELAELWRKRAPECVETYEFAAEQKLRHDLIGADVPGQKVDVVYPVLIELIDR